MARRRRRRWFFWPMAGRGAGRHDADLRQPRLELPCFPPELLRPVPLLLIVRRRRPAGRHRPVAGRGHRAPAEDRPRGPARRQPSSKGPSRAAASSLQQLTLTAVLHLRRHADGEQPARPGGQQAPVRARPAHPAAHPGGAGQGRQRPGAGPRHGGDAGARPAADGQVRPGPRMPDARSLGDERDPGRRRRPRPPRPACRPTARPPRPASGSRARRATPARQTRGARPEAARTRPTTGSRRPT